MASLTGQLVAETYKALLKLIDNDILTASEKQITDGFGGGSNVFIDSQGFLRANKYKVTNGLATQFLKADGSLDTNTYLTSITGAQVITALGYTPVTNQRTLTINGVGYNLTADRTWTIEGTAAVWGNITGTLSDQTDLQNALNAKFDDPTGTISQYIRGDGSIANFPAVTGFVPYTGATDDVDLGDYALYAHDLVIDHSSASGTAVDITKGGSGIAVNITKTGSGEALTVVKSSGSGNAASITGGVTLISELHLTTDLADAYIASAATWNAKIGGSGTTNYIPKFTAASVLGNSNIQDSGTLITLGSNSYISSGGLGIGTTSLTGYNLRVSKNITGATTATGISSAGVIQSDVTAWARLYNTYFTTVASSFTLTNVSHYITSQGTIGAGSTVTNQHGFYVDSSLTGATNNYGFYGNIASGTGRWNIYMNGTANNYLNGKLLIGTTTDAGYKLDVSGTGRLTGNLTASAFVKEGGTSVEYLKADGSTVTITGEIISGSGTAGYIPKFSSSIVLGNSLLYDNGTSMAIGTSTLNYGGYGRTLTGAAFASTSFGFEAVTGSTTDGNLIGGFSLVIANNDASRRIGSQIQSYISGATATNQGADLRFYVKPDAGVLLEIVRMTSGGITFNKDLTATNITATSFIKSGGTSTEFLMADGSVTTYTNPVTGTGSAGYIPKWTTAANIGSSLIYDDGTSIGIAYSTPNKGGYGRTLTGASFGSASFGFEAVGGTTTNGGLVGGLSFILSQNDSSRIVGSAIQSNLVGTTATNYGADLRFFAKADAGVIGEVARMTSAGLRVYGTIIKDGGTSSQFLMADGSVSTGVANPVGGTGTTNYLSKWTSGSAIGNSIVFDTGTNVGINTASPATILHVNGGATMTGGWNKTATLQAQFPTLIFNSNASKWGAIGYDYSNAMSFWVNGTSDNVNGTGLNAFQIYNSGSADFNYSLTVANALNVGKVGDVIYTKSNGTSYSRFLYSGANVNVVFTGGTDANNGMFGINNYEDTVRLFNMTNGGTAIFTGNVLVNGATTLTGIQGGVAVNGTTSSGIVYRLSNTNRGYTYMSQNGNMNVETTSGSISLAPNGSPAVTIATTGIATFSNTIIAQRSEISKSIATSDWLSSWNNTATNGHNMYFGYGNAAGTRFGLYISGGDGTNMDLAVNGKFYVMGTGNVLINTTTDAGYKLDVVGKGRFTSNGLSTFGLDIANTAGNRGAGFYTTGGNNVQLYFYNSAGTEKIVLDGGTGSGTFQSTVIATAPSNGIGFQLNGRSSDNIGQILFYANNGTTLQNYIQSRPTYFAINTETDIPMYFGTNVGGNGGTRLTILGNGNIGINTTSTPTYQNYRYLQITGNATNQGGVLYLTTSDSSYIGEIAINSGGLALSGTSSDVTIYAGNDQRMKVLAGGPINLGSTTNYLQTFNDGGGLYVEGTASTDAKRKIRIQMGNGSLSQYSSVFIDGANQAVGITTGNTTKLYVTQAGYVGIGTSGPTAPIHVIGGTAMTGGWNRTAMIRATYPVMVFNSNDTRWAGLGYDYSGSGAFILWVNGTSENVSGTGVQAFNIANNRNAAFYGSITATSFFESSDLRKKKLIKSNPIIAGIEKLEAKLYEKNGKIELGYFAQDAELIMPYAVTKNEDGFLNLSYREIHTAKIARLEKEVAELKEKLNVA